MKRVFAVWAMAAALSPSVLANDQKQLADPFGTDVAGHDWSGIYGGAAVGLSTGRSKRVPWGSTPDNLANDDGPAKFRGTIAGGFAGYQYQFANNAVVGVEGDYEYSTFKGNDNDNGGHVNGLDMDQSMSLRGRIGYAAGRTLFYGTAGVSRMSGTSKIVEVPQNNSSTSFIRWTAGGGFDTELSDHLFLRVEYRYSDYSLRVEDLTSYTLGFEPRRHDVRVGIGFKL